MQAVNYSAIARELGENVEIVKRWSDTKIEQMRKQRKAQEVPCEVKEYAAGTVSPTSSPTQHALPVVESLSISRTNSLEPKSKSSSPQSSLQSAKADLVTRSEIRPAFIPTIQKSEELPQDHFQFQRELQEKTRHRIQELISEEQAIVRLQEEMFRDQTHFDQVDIRMTQEELQLVQEEVQKQRMILDQLVQQCKEFDQHREQILHISGLPSDLIRKIQARSQESRFDPHRAFQNYLLQNVETKVHE